MIGTRLGSYEITAKLGEGGMGEVYRAHDSQLERDVALKVLPAALTEDPERLARFEREAKLLAQLNHSNIAQIYGLESTGASRALIMELVEGPTLAERLASGPLPIDEAIAIARQIAEALEAAHERGIVHRDLKPQNVKVRADGTVKVLDFGLAKAMDPAGSATFVADLARSPTMMQSPTLTAVHGTQLGVILGTAAYMAPEQARGGSVDKRADIWAFGVVLYEMLAGRSLFAGETVSDTLAGVLKTEIDFNRLAAETPPALRRLLRRCLERNPKNRLHDIADARIALDEIGAGWPEATTVAPAVVPPAWKRALPWLIAIGGVAIGVVGLFAPRRASQPEAATQPTTRFAVPTPGAGEIVDFPAISPDGRSLAFSFVSARDVPQLWLHSFDTGESRELRGTEYAIEPFWSPDGRHLGFFAAGELKRIEVASGLTQKVGEASDPRGGSWAEEKEIFFAPTSAAGLLRVAAAGGEVRPLSKVGGGEQSRRFPWVLPGGKALVYFEYGGQREGIHWLRLEDGQNKLLTSDDSRPVFDPRGQLIWRSRGTLVSRSFDPERGDFIGEPTLLAEEVGADPQRIGLAWFGAAAGTIAYRAGISDLARLRWMDRSGKVLSDVSSPGPFNEPALNGTDARVVATKSALTTGGEVWIYDTTGKDRGRRLSLDGATSTPVWSADDKLIYYTTESGGQRLIVAKRADGSGGEDVILQGEGASYWVGSASPREPLLVLEGNDAQGAYRLWLLSLTGDRRPRPFRQESKGSQAHAAFSPDGTLLAYTSDESGLPQVYVQPVEGSLARWQVSTAGGDLALWRADGKELFFVGLDRVLRAVPVSSLAPFTFGEPVELFPVQIPQLAVTGNRGYYAPSRDGQRFLVCELVREESDPGIQVILNWSPPR